MMWTSPGRIVLPLSVLLHMLMSSTDGKCAPDWTEYADQCYLYKPGVAANAVTAAAAKCQSLSGSLVFIRSQDENGAVVKTLLNDKMVLLGAVYSSDIPLSPNSLTETRLVIGVAGWATAKSDATFATSKADGYICQKPTDPPTNVHTSTVKLHATKTKLLAAAALSHTVISIIECADMCAEDNTCYVFNVCREGDRFKCDLHAKNWDELMGVGIGENEKCDAYAIIANYPAVRP